MTNFSQSFYMKILLTIFTLVFTVMFSSPSYSKWTKVGEDIKGDTFYVDYERIRKQGGYVYFWTLTDYLKRSNYGNLSLKTYNQGDCKLFRFKDLSYSYYKEPMGGGTGEVVKPSSENQEWFSPPPKSAGETVLKSVCSR